MSVSRGRWVFVAHCALLALVAGANAARSQEAPTFGDTEGCAPAFVSAVSDVLVLRSTATANAILELQCLRSAVVVTVRRADATFVRGIEVSDVPVRSRPRLVGILLGELLGRRDLPPRPPPAPGPTTPSRSSPSGELGGTRASSDSSEAAAARQTSPPVSGGRTAQGIPSREPSTTPAMEPETSGLWPAQPWPGPTPSLRIPAAASASRAAPLAPSSPSGAGSSTPRAPRSPEANMPPSPSPEARVAAGAEELVGTFSSPVDEFESSLPRMSEPFVSASAPRVLDTRAVLGTPRLPATSMPPALWLVHLEPPSSRALPMRIDGEAALRIFASTPFALGGARARVGFDALELGALALASGFADALGQATVWCVLGEASLVFAAISWRTARVSFSTTVHLGVVGVEARAAAGALGAPVVDPTGGATLDIRGALGLTDGLALVGQAGVGAAYGPMLQSGQELRAGLGGLMIDVSIGIVGGP